MLQDSSSLIAEKMQAEKAETKRLVSSNNFFIEKYRVLTTFLISVE
jgi:hypothetical protein